MDSPTYERLLEASAPMPGCVFPLGFDSQYLSALVQQRDASRGLCLGALLDSTPLNWVECEPFRIAKQLVTNADYLAFLLDGEAETEGGFYERSELWQFIWDELNFRITQHSESVQQAGKVEAREEDYHGAISFIEAYLELVRFDIGRALLGQQADSSLEGVPFSSESFQFDELDELMAYIKFKLKHCLPSLDPDGWWDFLTQSERQGFRRLTELPEPKTKVTGQLESIIDRVKSFYRQNLTHRERRVLDRQSGGVECLRFLENFARAQKSLELEQAVPLRKVLFPRHWRSPRGQGDSPSSRFRQARGPVPWEQRPLVGITLYEAVAYTCWLSEKIGYKAQVKLPDEAQYERAASWPTDMLDLLDPTRKSIYPWPSEAGDFHDFFGIDGFTLETLFSDKVKYQEVLKDSARALADGQELEQLMGFAWQWTGDSYDTRTPRYDRLRELKSRAGVDFQDNDIEIFQYRAHQHRNHSYYVVRGAPYHLGGPGLTTRRFALFPMRAYTNVGFRWVLVEGEGE